MLGAGFSVYRAADFDRQPEFAAAFDALCDADWQAAGVWRWRDFLRSDGPHPMVVIAQRDAAATLLGVIVGLWQPAVVNRFDDLFDAPTELSPRWRDELGWPIGGFWHLIALTVAPAARGSGAQQALVAAALGWVLDRGGVAQVRTLSPAQGLPEAAALVASLPAYAASSPEVQMQQAIAGLCDEKGRPWLPILRVHPSNGADLEAVLFDSRADEVRSGCVTLRFAYHRSADARAAQFAALQAWVAARATAIAAGEAEPVESSRGSAWFVAPQGALAPPWSGLAQR